MFKDVSARIIWINSFLRKIRYKTIKFKKIKHEVRSYIKDVTNVTDKTISLWISKYKHGKLKPQTYKRHVFHKIYTWEDIILLVKVDAATERISVSSLCNLFKREYNIYHKQEFKRLSGISRSHINNLRNTETYKRKNIFGKISLSPYW